MPITCCQLDDVAGVVERGDRVVAVGVTDLGVDEIEDADREDLDPPVEDGAVAQDPGPGEPAAQP